MTTVEHDEVYPNAPVVLVVLEVRHPPVSPLTHDQQLTIKQRLASHVPIMRNGQVPQFTLVEAPGMPGGPPQMHVEEFPRYSSRDGTLTVSLRTDAVAIETTRYLGWDHLRALVSDVLTARLEIGSPDGVERIGLRYVDEIRTLDDSVHDWSPWVDSALLGPSSIGEELDIGPAQWEGATAFESSPERAIALRYGPRQGFAVDPAGGLKRSAPTSGAFFLMDIDSFWVAKGEVPEFAVETLLSTCDELHAPVRRLFERLITDRLREEILRRAD